MERGKRTGKIYVIDPTSRWNWVERPGAGKEEGSTNARRLPSSLSERTDGQSCQPLRQRMCYSRHGHTRQKGMRSQAEQGSAIVTERTGKMPPSPRYAQDKVWKRLRLNAKQTRYHSPAAAEIPRKENWRKPSTSLMMPITGSTVHLRAP